MAKRDDKKYYAYVEHETVQAMLHSLFRFQTAMQAQLVSNRFADEVILSPKMRDPKDRAALFLWVRGLDVTEDQQKLGYLGNYAKISLLKLPNGKWTLNMVRVDIPLVKHPLRVKVSRRYPNSGHPVLRSAARGKTYSTMQSAFDALMKMHEEFPEVSIPGVNRLKIMTYRKAEKGVSPIQRLELSVVKRDEGKYVIDVKIVGSNGITRPASAPPLPDAIVKATKEKPSPEAAGFYTEMVTKRRKKKKK